MVNKKIPRYCVYKVLNLINGKFYIGATKDPDERWKNHLATAKNKTAGIYSYVHKAINKYGSENFTFEVLVDLDSWDAAKIKEVELIKELGCKNCDVGYNLTDGGDGLSGYEYSPEQRKAQSERMKGKFCGDKNPFYGKTHTDETKAKISEGRLNASVENYSGEKSSQAKLTNAQVFEMKELYFVKNESIKNLEEKFLISKAEINAILSGSRWSQIKHPCEKIFSRKEKIEKAWSSNFGQMITKELICDYCKNIFIITGRERSKAILRGKRFCSDKCKITGVLTHNHK